MCLIKHDVPSVLSSTEALPCLCSELQSAVLGRPRRGSMDLHKALVPENVTAQCCLWCQRTFGSNRWTEPVYAGASDADSWSSRAELSLCRGATLSGQGASLPGGEDWVMPPVESAQELFHR